MRKDIAPRREAGMVSRKGGGNVRVIGITRSHDGKKRTAGLAKERPINKERRQHRNFIRRRWQTDDEKRAICNRNKQYENPVTSHGLGGAELGIGNRRRKVRESRGGTGKWWRIEKREQRFQPSSNNF